MARGCGSESWCKCRVGFQIVKDGTRRSAARRVERSCPLFLFMRALAESEKSGGGFVSVERECLERFPPQYRKALRGL